MPLPAEPEPDDALEQAALLARRFADFLGHAVAGGVAGGIGSALPGPGRLAGHEPDSPGRAAGQGGIPPQGGRAPWRGGEADALEAANGRGAGFGETGRPLPQGPPPQTPPAAPAPTEAPRPATPQPAPEETARLVMDRLDLEFKRTTSLSLTEALTCLRDRLRREGAG